MENVGNGYIRSAEGIYAFPTITLGVPTEDVGAAISRLRTPGDGRPYGFAGVRWGTDARGRASLRARRGGVWEIGGIGEAMGCNVRKGLV